MVVGRGIHRRTLWGFTHIFTYFVFPTLTLLEARQTLAMIVDPNCNYVLKNAPGDFTSPDYPDGYPDNKVCQWTIIMPKYEKIKLIFSLFNVKRGTSDDICDNDYVEVIDGTVSLGRFCNSLHRLPNGILSTSNVLRVIFKSAKTGFRGTFQVNYQKNPCGNRLTGLQGKFLSPNYPRPYPSEKKCIWQIDAPSDKVIELSFDVFELNQDSDCRLDFVKVRDGLKVTSTEIGHYCQSRKPPSIIRSTGDKMWIEFSSFSEGEGRGFSAQYELAKHCGGSFISDTGSFSSPGFPGARPRQQECYWKIQVPQNKIISINFDSFDVRSMIQSGESCGADYVAVYDGFDTRNKLLRKLCKSLSEPLNIFSTGNGLVVELQTSFANTGKGFFASYSTIDPDNHYKGCFEMANEVLFTCDNGRIVHCDWKCDGTNECGDNSDEDNCPKPTEESKKDNQLKDYVIIVLSVTGSVMVTVVIGCIADRLRKKHRSRLQRRSVRCRHRLRASDTVPLTEPSDPSTPPPAYEVAIEGSAAVSFPPHMLQNGDAEAMEVDATASVLVARMENAPAQAAVTSGNLPNVTEVLATEDEHSSDTTPLIAI